ncbi:site-specific integrase [Aeromicrobium sp.]|uniref:site-specific integrase n=1 Tax=Aeromicrobium sp. TaxID=1871063 RepID=UPI0030BFDB60
MATGVTLPTDQSADNQRTLERWTADNLVKFTRHADTDDLAIGWRMLSLGMRREEVLGMAWDAVDFEAGTITIKRARVRVSKGTDPRGWVVGPPKSKASRRTIRPDDIQPGTVTMLKARWLAAGRPATGFVVVNSFGEPVEPGWFSDRFAAVQRAAGVPVIRAHSCRHTVAYLLHSAGVPAVRAAAYLGHRLDVHVSVYLFARDGDIDTAAVALGEVHATARTGT